MTLNCRIKVKVKGAGEIWGTRDLSTLRATSAMRVIFRSLRFKALIDTAPVMFRHVAYHQADDWFVPSVDIVKKTELSSFKLTLECFLNYYSRRELFKRTMFRSDIRSSIVQIYLPTALYCSYISRLVTLSILNNIRTVFIIRAFDESIQL